MTDNDTMPVIKWHRIYKGSRSEVDAGAVPHAVLARAERFRGSVRPGTALFIPDTGGDAAFVARCDPCYLATMP